MSSTAVTADETEQEPHPDPKARSGAMEHFNALWILPRNTEDREAHRASSAHRQSQEAPPGSWDLEKPIPLLLFFSLHRQAAHWYAQMDI